MCLILFAHKVHPQYPLIIIANRDEFYNRPTEQAKYWVDKPSILAGKDLQGKGTWMGLSTDRKLAALTNYRDPHHVLKEAPSRGKLPLDFLNQEVSAEAYIEQLRLENTQYNGYNLLLYDGTGLWCYDNIRLGKVRVDAGVGGLSNAHINTPWPKVTSGIDELSLAVQNGKLSEDVLFKIMENKTLAQDHLLPSTGVPQTWEKILSARFIVSETYGTRISTIVMFSEDGTIQFTEKTHGTINSPASVVRYVI